MENIYTIKIRTYPDPNNSYPSERRYSASMVLGLGIVHIVLGLTAFLLASLTLLAKNNEIDLQKHQSSEFSQIDQLPTHLTLDKINDPEIARKLEMYSRITVYIKRKTDEELNQNMTELPEMENFGNHTEKKTRTSRVSEVTLAPCFMTMAALMAGVTGILAWRRWYIDQNITWFFMTSCVSTLAATVCLIFVSLALAQKTDFHLNNYGITQHFLIKSENGIDVLEALNTTSSDKSYESDYNYNARKNEHLRMVLALNITIATVIELIWSLLSMRVAYRGMKNGYPEDLTVRRGGHLQVNTIYKGNNIGRRKIIPKPDVIAHYPKKGKFAKYFPKNDTRKDYLPKAESHKEYQERVNKFLTSISNEEISK